MGKPVKAIHALNWYYRNIYPRKCPENRQKEHDDRMREIIRGHEEYLITHKMFVKIMHEKHYVCGLTDESLRKPTRDFWKLDCMPI